ncbi:MAG: prepilin-type N-terminal cleavage/methylation domain-containing protein [Pseudomonadota bacterium]
MGRRGFTLAELMVVVAIIGIISSFAIPHVSGVITRSKKSEIHLLINGIATSEIDYYITNLRFKEAGPLSVDPKDPSKLNAKKIEGSQLAIANDPDFKAISFAIDQDIFSAISAEEASGVNLTKGINAMVYYDLNDDDEVTECTQEIRVNQLTYDAYKNGELVCNPNEEQGSGC